MDGRYFQNSLRRLRLFAAEADLTSEKVTKLVQPFIQQWRPLAVPNRKDAHPTMDPDLMLSNGAIVNLVARIRAAGMNLNKAGLKGIHYHNAFQREISRMAEMFDCRGWKESAALFDDPEIAPHETPTQLAGRVDVLWSRNRTPVVVFEIDSTVKPRSFQKLKEAAAPHKIWVYFGRDIWGFRMFLQKFDPAKEIVPVIVPPTFIPSFDDEAADAATE